MPTTNAKFPVSVIVLHLQAAGRGLPVTLRRVFSVIAI